MKKGCGMGGNHTYCKIGNSNVDDILRKFNYSYNNSDSTVPGFNKSITTTASVIGNELVNKSVTWLKFFLTVPTRQAAGNYTNTITTLNLRMTYQRALQSSPPRARSSGGRKKCPKTVHQGGPCTRGESQYMLKYCYKQ